MIKNILISVVASILYLAILIFGYKNQLVNDVYIGGGIGLASVILGYFAGFLALNRHFMSKVFYFYLVVAFMWSSFATYYLWGHLTGMTPRRIVGLVFLCITMVAQYGLFFEFLRGRIKIHD